MKTSITNHGNSPMYVGTTMIPAGETRLVDTHDPPPAVTVATGSGETSPPAPAADALLELLDNPIPVIIDAITARDAAGAPKIRDEELKRLKDAEEAGKTRKGLMAVIAEEEIRRANEQQPDPEMDAFVATLKTMSDDELLDQLELHAGQDAMIAAIESVINERAAAETAPQ